MRLPPAGSVDDAAITKLNRKTSLCVRMRLQQGSAEGMDPTPAAKGEVSSGYPHCRRRLVGAAPIVGDVGL